jgi:A/G-specific adenine glycosylase
MGNRSFPHKNLLAWYREHHRPLPWRSTRDPFYIWISEILLQQTRVGTAIGYYERLLERFPTLSDLADAPIEAVLQVWQGLGYYGRARNLHRAARMLKDECGGKIPSEPEALRKLPGVGPYTAAAIASIAFSRDEAVVDGNVTRVLCRVWGIREDPNKPATRTRLQRIADGLLPKGNAAAFNQALMELGALVCTPARPDCLACPINAICVANKKKMTKCLPFRAPRAKIPLRLRVVAAVEHRGRLLFRRRDPEGLLGGLWELPGVYLEKREGEQAGLRRLARQMGRFVTLARIPDSSDFSIRHVYSHFEESIRVYLCEGKSDLRRSRTHTAEQTHRWIHPNRLAPYPITGATRKILQRLEHRKAPKRG